MTLLATCQHLQELHADWTPEHVRQEAQELCMDALRDRLGYAPRCEHGTIYGYCGECDSDNA